MDVQGELVEQGRSTEPLAHQDPPAARPTVPCSHFSCPVAFEVPLQGLLLGRSQAYLPLPGPYLPLPEAAIPSGILGLEETRAPSLPLMETPRPVPFPSSAYQPSLPPSWLVSVLPTGAWGPEQV